MFKKIQAFMTRMLKPRQQELRLVVDDNEVRLLTGGKEAWCFRWDAVVKIETYKRDIFSMDLVCLDFLMESQPSPCRTHEDMKGFNVLKEHMQRRFSSIREGWLEKVSIPPFAANHMVLYERK